MDDGREFIFRINLMETCVMKTKYVKMLGAIFLFNFIFGFLAVAANNLNIYVPVGWLNITDSVALSKTQGLPQKLIDTSKKSICKLLSGDPKTFGDKYPTYFAWIHLPQMDNFKLSDASLKGLGDGIMSSAKNSALMSIVENKVITINGIKIFYSIMDLNLNLKTGKIVVRSVSYYVPDGNGASMISFYTLKDEWEKYSSVFGDIVSKTLK